MDLKATTKQMSIFKNKPEWATPGLDSKTGFHNSKEDSKDHKNFWIEIDLKRSSEVQKVILMRRGDIDKAEY